MADFVVGEYARLSLALVDFAGNAADPGALRLKTKSAAGTLTTLTYGVDSALVRDGAGLFHADIALTEAGSWYYRWESDTPNPGASEGALQVVASRVL